MTSIISHPQVVAPTTKDSRPSASLKELLESSRNLPKRLNDIGTIHLGLNEIKRKAYEIRKYNKTDKDSNPYTKAHYLLVGSGITIEEIQSELDSIDCHAIDPSAASQAGLTTSLNTRDFHGDIDSYISNQKDENILSAIEQSLSTAATDFDRYVNQNITIDWKQRKTELRDSLSALLKRGKPSTDIVSLPTKKPKAVKESLDTQLTWGNVKTKSILSSKFGFSDIKQSSDRKPIINPNVSYALRQKFELYAQVIYELNDAREEGKSYPLSTVFADLSKHEVNSRSKQLHEAWLIIRDFCDNDTSSASQSLERMFAKSYSADSLSDFESVSLRKRIVNKSRSYLENQFLDYITELYSTSDKSTDDKLATNTAKVQNFLDLTLKTKIKEWKIQNLTFINGVPIWAILFYLLRAGCYEEAVYLINENNDSFQKLERSFPTYLKSYCDSDDRKLSVELRGRLINEFNQSFKHNAQTADPFRYATYKLIGRCELSKKTLPSITLSIEDWLWLHLCLIKEDDSEDDDPIHEFYTLNDLQKSILQFGPESFNSSNANPMYLQALIFTGLYEDAVKHLFEYSEIDAVHLSITLAYYGLLRVSPCDDSDDSLVTSDSNGFKVISYARLIGYYTRTFKISDPRVAAEYLFCICLCDGLKPSLKAQQIELGQEAIRELVLETREFVLLLGKIDKDGTRIPGVIESRKKLLYLSNEESYLSKIAEQAAVKADEEGRPFDCILLYQLSEEFDTVISLVNRVLGEFLISIDLRANIDDVINEDVIKGETNIAKLATRLMKTYNSSPKILSKVSLKHRETCTTLLEILRIRKEFTSFNPDLVFILELIGKLNLIPCSSSIELEKIRVLSQEFSTLDESIAKNIPNLLVIEMSCIAQLFFELNQSFENGALNDFGSSNVSKEDKLAQLRAMSRNCMIYTGMVQYKMPREVYTTLVNLEVNM
ncbi:hypothetical protein CANARDRAFT_26856 [[Candida] arabinofermentans NRRL YB-2248]|uniref:Nuclear pore protein n=1 Tax=[Candida] arabinofermentans NRRL YB-2248 TaxID=983967 RepID=A0A1E4T6S4_9ASCO|nr:hypothetical protein CANARDRAFT_26856 [[Candida] arabinofermentans NRRL YB-2248]